ncbi:FIST N domain-containing protein [Methanolobus vulcani]|uniref:FIST N domain-containing protein n=1 Tax=Methanolobus vulcani TaxID=38026 RepID=A0A7Z7AU23_9EURY|nr:FIST C-terminal domain-containing protein [Methanolobus vulcani]SDF22017.1 FIST N domain-containing protein [Methanolobus vulcani]
MIFMYVPSSEIDNIVDAVKNLNVKNNEAVLLMIGERNHPDIDILIAELNEMKIDFFGAIFPGIIHNTDTYDTGTIVHVIPIIYKPILIEGIKDPRKKLEQSTASFNLLCKKGATAFIIVDGMTANIAPLLTSMYNLFADSIEYLGCGAGYIDMQQKPCIISPEGFFEDAALITFFDTECEIGVHHGWKRDVGPLVVTKSFGNIIKELNWRNALEVFGEALQVNYQVDINTDNGYNVLSHYPFGIYVEDHEDLIREVLKINDNGELVCAGNIPENVVLSILKGDKEELFHAAEMAVEDCLGENNIDAEHCFVIDCIGRASYLQDDFKEELSTIKRKIESKSVNVVPEGVLSAGEIASMKGDVLEYFNKTIVIGVLHGPREKVCRNI